MLIKLIRSHRLCALSTAAVMTFAGGSAWGDVLSHTGTAASGGTGAVNVDMFSVPSVGGLQVGLAYHEPATHVFAAGYDPAAAPSVFLAEFSINNETGVAWNAFQVQLLGSDFFGVNGAAGGGPLAREVDPVLPGGVGPTDISFQVNSGSIGLAGSAIGRDGSNATLFVAFSDPVDPGEAFGLAFFVNDVGTPDSVFVVGQTPLVPEPASLWLLAFGTGFVATRWRRR